MDDIVAQCPGVLVIHDDIFIYRKDDRDHDANIIDLFNVAQKRDLFSIAQNAALNMTLLHSLEEYFLRKVTHQIQ